MTFVFTTPSRVYRENDVHLAEELALRAALAIENARLYREARRAIGARGSRQRGAGLGLPIAKGLVEAH
jgi:GAF domain-containing protein